MKKIAAFLWIAIALVSTSLTSHAWNATGHRIIAMIAYGQLSEIERAAAVAILKKHGRFAQDFESLMPGRVKDADSATQDQWIFLHASTWPDIARGFSGEDREAYHHPTWHYINEPYFLTVNDREILEESVRAKMKLEWEPQLRLRLNSLNVIQALKRAEYFLTKRETSQSEKAVHLCWLFHLAGDLHQPLHSTALFSANRFPEGDRGGNGIEAGSRNLHSLWDGLLGANQNQMATIARKSDALLQDRALVEMASGSLSKMEFQDWMMESFAAAKAHVYSLDILEKASAAELESRDLRGAKLDAGARSEEYLENAKAIANQRAIQAGFRLAKKLKEYTL